MKHSKGQAAKILVVYSILGLGIGGIVALALVLMKKIPDQATPIFMIAIPIGFVYVLIKMIRTFNTISFEGDSITVRRLFGNEREYVLNNYQIQASIGGYSVYQQAFAPVLYLTMKPVDGGKGQQIILPLYNQKQIESIISIVLPKE